MTGRKFVSALALALGLALASGQQAEVSIKPVSYRQLGDIVKQHRGKVVLLDFWADS